MTFVLARNADAQVSLPYEEHFNYPDGAALGDIGAGSQVWTNGNSIGPGGVTNSSVATLSFAGLADPGGIGVIVPLGTSTRSKGIGFNIGSFGSGNPTMYVSFLLNIQSAPTSLRRFCYMRNGTGTGNGDGIWVTTTNTLMIGKNGSSPDAAAGVTPVLSNGTHLVVIRHKWVSGVNNDEVALWVDPGSLGVVEALVPGATLSTITGGSDLSTLVNFMIPMASGDSGIFWLDELRLGATWASVTPAGCPPGTAFDVTGGGSFCSGDTGVSVGLSGSETGVDYQLRRNGVPVGAPLPGTGAALDFGLQTVAGEYTVMASNTVTFCKGAMNTNAAVVVNTSPSITISPTNSTGFFGGSISIAVGASGSGLTYQWRRDGTNLVNGGNISGASTAALVISPLGPVDAAGTTDGYDVVISGICSPPQTSTRVSLTIVPPAELVWTGDGGANNWDLSGTPNFLNGGSPAVFNPGDKVTFGEPATNPIVNIVGALAPTSVTVTGANNYAFVGAGSINGSTTLTKSGSGTLTISNPNGFTGKTTINGGTVSIAADTALGAPPVAAVADQLTLDGGTLRTTAGFALAANRGITLGTGSGTFDVTGTLTGNSRVTGTGTLTKTGPGTLQMDNGANNYSGDTIITSGSVSVDADGVPGSAAGTIYLSGGRLTVSADRGTNPTNAPIGNPLVLTADSELTTTATSSETRMVLTNDVFSGTAGTLTLRNDGADAASDVFTIRHYGEGFTFGRPMVLATGNLGAVSTFRSYNLSGTQTFTGVISGTGTFHRRSSLAGTAGETIFSGDNTFTGGVTLSDGTIGLGISSTGNPVTSGPLGTGTFTIVNTTGSANRLHAVGGARTLGNGISWQGQPLVINGINDLTLSGWVDLNSGTRTIIVSNTAATIISGVISNGALTLAGPGVLTITGTNIYTGTTIVNEGTLAGTGVIGGPVTVNSGGTIAPGASIGSLLISNSLTLAAGSTTSVEVNSAASPNCDSINGLTSVSYDGTLQVANLGPTLTASDSFKLFTAASYSGVFAAISPATPAAGLVWNTNTLTTDGTLRIAVESSGPSNEPTNITSSVNGNLLTLSWPSSHTGWTLQVQTNNPGDGLSTNWFDVSGSDMTNYVILPFDAGTGSIFYRLRLQQP